MSLLSRLFGSKPEVEVEPEEYKGFAIYPEPVREGSTWRVAARIEKDVDGERKVHKLIRADTVEVEDTAIKASAAKARQVIDEQGDRIFG
ncbi:HlyU family transcriptional regulator [Pseudoruegeria sp. HB172150]|uniref:HlyU family transcriptional regulator n=1 Tax=Pseudoruegeria sp. HB172150 TaxID=2721164 RepID=UPI00155500A2|nr:HlyU family transcriptional regulator [Pseudoruegeria sp. HB172150]